MKATTKKNALTWLKEGGIYVVLLVLLASLVLVHVAEALTPK